MRRVWALAAAVLVAGCATTAPPATGPGTQAGPSTRPPAPGSAPAAGGAGATPTTAVPAPASSTHATVAAAPAPARPPRPAAAPATTAPAAPPPPPTAGTPEPFAGSVSPIDAATAARLTASWRPGCPVGLEDLRLVTVTHRAFDGDRRTGELVVRAGHAEALVGVFRRLYEVGFPIAQMRLVDEFGADDDRSMAANNTSAFNCRTVAGSARWSEHAYGEAVDINPVQNPYVTRTGVSPPAGAAFTARDPSTPGLITAAGPVVAAFRSIGWGWGGSWSGGKDYQHFSASGR